jgi:predicted nucleotidyltransferase
MVAVRRAGSFGGVVVEEQIVEAGRRLACAAPHARVILFGSHARGSAGPRSDIDILVIEPGVENEAIERARLATCVFRSKSSSSASAMQRTGVP